MHLPYEDDILGSSMQEGDMLQAEQLVGTWRRFGAVGPVYEIVANGKGLSGGDQFMRIRVIETGEEIDYKLADILDDPKER